VPGHNDAASAAGMLVDVVLAFLAALPTVTLKPRNNLRPVGLQPRHAQIYAHEGCSCKKLAKS